MKKNYEIPEKAQNTIYLILFFLFNILAISTVVANKDNMLVLSIYLGIYVSISSIRHIFMHTKKIRYFIILIEAALVLTMQYIDQTTNAIFILIILAADIITAFPHRFAISTCASGFLIYIITALARNQEALQNQDEFVQFIMKQLAIALLAVLPMFIAKHQVIQSTKMKDLLKEIKLKTNELEEMALYKERSRIAGEIHDTVGHTLTSVLVTLEAVKMLIFKDPQKAYDKINAAREQVKKGLYEIRNSVRNIKDGGLLLDYDASFHSVLKEMEKDLAIEIEKNIEIKEQLKPIQYHTLLRIIQESVTNGIRHGNANYFIIHIHTVNSFIRMSIWDNGMGVSVINEGFGLNNMKDRVSALEGEISFVSGHGKGFATKVSLPLEKRSIDD